MSAQPNYSETINFWPAVMDMLAATLMVFVLTSYLETTLQLDDLEIISLREKQAQFVSELQASMQNDIDNNRLNFQLSPEAILIRFSDQILFEPSDYRLKRNGQDVLRRFGQVLSKNVGDNIQRIQVEGHTDNTPIRMRPGSYDHVYPSNNWELSSARATSVVLFLSSHVVNLSEQLFSANGFSSFRPIDRGNTRSAREKNRRVEIRLIFSNLEER